jgi:hypothetical protein
LKKFKESFKQKTTTTTTTMNTILLILLSLLSMTSSKYDNYNFKRQQSNDNHYEEEEDDNNNRYYNSHNEDQGLIDLISQSHHQMKPFVTYEIIETVEAFAPDLPFNSDKNGLNFKDLEKSLYHFLKPFFLVKKYEIDDPFVNYKNNYNSRHPVENNQINEGQRKNKKNSNNNANNYNYQTNGRSNNQKARIVNKKKTKSNRENTSKKVTIFETNTKERPVYESTEFPNLFYDSKTQLNYEGSPHHKQLQKSKLNKYRNHNNNNNNNNENNENNNSNKRSSNYRIKINNYNNVNSNGRRNS